MTISNFAQALATLVLKPFECFFGCKVFDFFFSFIIIIIIFKFYLRTTYNTKQLQVLLTIRQFTNQCDFLFNLQSNLHTTYKNYTILTSML